MQKAFTLIELLVVVLIIGVLSAIALPQYQRAVKRSRGAEALTIAGTLAQAVQSYYLANNTYNGITNDSVLDISLPTTDRWGYSQIGSPVLLTDNSVSMSFNGCTVQDQKCKIQLVNQDGVSLFMEVSQQGTYMYCWRKGSMKCTDYFPCSKQVGTIGDLETACSW